MNDNRKVKNVMVQHEISVKTENNSKYLRFCYEKHLLYIVEGAFFWNCKIVALKKLWLYPGTDRYVYKHGHFCKQSLFSDRLDSVYTGENSLSEGGGSVKGGEGGGAEYVETASWDPSP